ncbi:MAG: signal peptidase I [Clostridia bacterium]|nr:signal peptidase I [Clostridia bacterium]
MNNDNFYTPKAEELFKTKTTEQIIKKGSKQKFSDLFEWCDVISISLICVIILFSFCFKVVRISGDSMLETLHSNEMVIITDLGYTPKAGDIVVISRNVENSAETISAADGPIIKRVIATENQEVDIRGGKVYVDGQELNEDYLTYSYTQPSDVEFPLTVPKGHIFVLGDNRPCSLDSRRSSLGDNGMIDSRYVLGHAIFRVFPFAKFGSLNK